MSCGARAIRWVIVTFLPADQDNKMADVSKQSKGDCTRGAIPFLETWNGGIFAFANRSGPGAMPKLLPT
jgi:hypothetical protein